jgi:RNA-splicing ligase RtcB
MLSRTRARKQVGGAELRRQLEDAAITVRCPSNKGLAEGTPFAYKDVEKLVEVVERAGLRACGAAAAGRRRQGLSGPAPGVAPRPAG